MSRMLLHCVTCSIICLALFATPAVADSDWITSGRLEVVTPDGVRRVACPLEHTNVTVDIAGFVARVTVRQKFHNPLQEKIEAVYVFPLSQDAAVDRMTMAVGKRLIVGEIRERAEAQRIYASAKAGGHVAGLLDQERPNIFTQSVANIEPGAQVEITIKYSETLDWRDGDYHFDFPLVVAPRYMPGTPTGDPRFGREPPTDQVPDAGRISPPVPPTGLRAGHDVSLTVNLQAGLTIRRIESLQHDVSIAFTDQAKTRARVALKKLKEIPNKDFVLVYRTATDRIEDTLLTHTDPRGKFFTLVLQPPQRVPPAAVVPKEIIFVIDKSGSMGGFPIETAKQAMRLCIEGLHPKDTFNLMTFEGGRVSFCFPQPVTNTEEHRRLALDYLASLQGRGGTEMMPAIRACLAGRHDPQRLRVVCFMTDGNVGHDMAIVDAVRANAGLARVFAFGIGRSVNRFLLDGIARAGRGEVHYLLDERQAGSAASRFYERVRTPVLANVELDFGDLKVEDVYPSVLPDLFSVKPVVVKGRYTQGGRGVITLKGTTGSGRLERKIEVHLPDNNRQHEVLAPLWARAKIDEVMGQDLLGLQRNTPQATIRNTILELGVRYQLLTRFTSFVAVERQRVTKGGEPKTVAVPAELPEDVEREGVLGAAAGTVGARKRAIAPAPANWMPIKDEVADPRGRVRSVELDRDAQFQRVVRLTDQIHQFRSVRAEVEQRRRQIAGELARRKEILNRCGLSVDEPPDRTPPQVGGVVSAVSGSGLVEITIGSDDGLRVGHRLDVFSDKSYLGRVRIRKTLPDRAVGEIEPAFKKGDIQAGARVASVSMADAGARRGNGKPERNGDSPPDAADQQDVLTKLAPPLRGLAARVAQAGNDRNLKVGTVIVQDGRVKLQLQLTAVSADVLKQLTELGFQMLAQPPSATLVTGTLDVARLDDLAKLACVVRIEPAS